jgi:hypothetical protein
MREGCLGVYTFVWVSRGVVEEEERIIDGDEVKAVGIYILLPRTGRDRVPKYISCKINNINNTTG